MSYDPKCVRLAMEFLQDHPALWNSANADKLAQEIQRVIEEWIVEEENKKCQQT